MKHYLKGSCSLSRYGVLCSRISPRGRTYICVRTHGFADPKNHAIARVLCRSPWPLNISFRAFRA